MDTRFLLKATGPIGLAVVFVATLETCARLDDWIVWGAPPWRPYSSEILRVADAAGLHNRPDARFEKWTINSLGFRGEHIARAKPRGVSRVMAIGASETFGLYESPGMEYPAQLQRILDGEAPGRYQVINAASPGMSPPRIVEYYRAYLRQFEPDVVVFYPSPFFYLARRPPAYGSVVAGGLPMPSAWRPRLASKASNLAKRVLPEAAQTRLKEVLIRRAVAAHPAGWVFERVPPDRPPLFERHLADLAAEVRSSGAVFVVLTHAYGVSGLEGEANRRLLVGWRKLDPHVSYSCLIENEDEINRIVKALPARPDVVVVDAEALVPKSGAYFADHVHFTDRGAGTLARAIARAVRSAVPGDRSSGFRGSAADPAPSGPSRPAAAPGL